MVKMCSDYLYRWYAILFFLLILSISNSGEYDATRSINLEDVSERLLVLANLIKPEPANLFTGAILTLSKA